MPASLLDRMVSDAESLTREEQLELARRLLNRAVLSPARGGARSITELISMGGGTWKTAEEVRQYIEEERGSWERSPCRMAALSCWTPCA